MDILAKPTPEHSKPKAKKISPSLPTCCAYCGVTGKRFPCCSRCEAVCYCSEDCQVYHWKEHQKICNILNVGDAAQIFDKEKHMSSDVRGFRAVAHLAAAPYASQQAWKVFITEDDNPKTAAKIKNLLKRLSSTEKTKCLSDMLHALILMPTKMLKRETSPFLLLLKMEEGVHPDTVITTESTQTFSALHLLGGLAARDNIQTHVNQRLLAKQLIQAGADVNIKTPSKQGFSYNNTPLHYAARPEEVTNLSFIKLLLDHGADPNIQTIPYGETVLTYNNKCSISAAKFLLNYSNSIVAGAVDWRIKKENGTTFLGIVRHSIAEIKKKIAVREISKDDDQGDSDLMGNLQLLQLHEEVEAILIKCGATDDTFIAHQELIAKPPEFELISNVSSLLDQPDIKKTGPSWYKKNTFYCYDPMALHFELLGLGPHLHTGYMCTSSGKNYYDFDLTKPPAVGQRMVIWATLPVRPISVECERDLKASPVKAYLSGRITHVYQPPTEKQLRRLKSYLYKKKCACKLPTCKITKTGSYREIVDCFGCVDGAQVLAVVSLNESENFSNETKALGRAFFGSASTQYQVLLQANDFCSNQWEVTSITRLAAGRGTAGQESLLAITS